MITVTVDGRSFPCDPAAVRTLGELVELVKASIDPDSIITSVQLNGKELTDNDWRTPLIVQEAAALDMCTGSRKEYVSQRLAAASGYVDRIREGFGKAASALKGGDVQGGNVLLAQSVEDFKAFVNWYNTLIKMAAGMAPEQDQRFESSIKEITQVCEQLLQQQLYRAWWTVAETIENRLSPQLEALKGCCLLIFNAWEKA